MTAFPAMVNREKRSLPGPRRFPFRPPIRRRMGPLSGEPDSAARLQASTAASSARSAYCRTGASPRPAPLPTAGRAPSPSPAGAGTPWASPFVRSLPGPARRGREFGDQTPFANAREPAYYYGYDGRNAAFPARDANCGKPAMKKIVSVSRRTDVPAFYADWFMRRLAEGRAGYVQPFGGKRYLVSLRPADAAVFVFWSKNFMPFTEKLRTIKASGYHSYFNYTINNYPRVFEPAVPPAGRLIENLKELSDRHSPAQINWRYDPIVISQRTDYDFHLRNFEKLASALSGYVHRCTVSFVSFYGKVKKSFARLQQCDDARMEEPEIEAKVRLANELADRAGAFGMKLHSCCCGYLENEKIGRAHCVDGELLKELFFKNDADVNFKPKPTRAGCGCAESLDVGAYDTCAHGCVYCYANANQEIARAKYERREIDSAFLGFSRAQSERWLTEIENDEKNDTGRERRSSLF
jgi:DNA repair photolyase